MEKEETLVAIFDINSFINRSIIDFVSILIYSENNFIRKISLLYSLCKDIIGRQKLVYN